MGNSLERNIAKGEEVVVKRHILNGVGNRPIEDRVFVCTGGEGMSRDSHGRRILGYWLSRGDAYEDVIYGYWIDEKETTEWQSVK